MLHLTVDAWRLQRLHSFPQLTSHTCDGPAGFTKEARGLSIGRFTSQIWISILLQDLPMRARLRSGGQAAQPRPAGYELNLGLYGKTE